MVRNASEGKKLPGTVYGKSCRNGLTNLKKEYNYDVYAMIKDQRHDKQWLGLLQFGLLQSFASN